MAFYGNNKNRYFNPIEENVVTHSETPAEKTSRDIETQLGGFMKTTGRLFESAQKPQDKIYLAQLANTVKQTRDSVSLTSRSDNHNKNDSDSDHDQSYSGMTPGY